MIIKKFDRIIIGSGIYGLYAAYLSLLKGYSVLVLEYDDAPFKRATSINQARIHLGYHYPRSISTAFKSKNYYNRFIKEFKNSVNDTFLKVYATSTSFSWTNSDQFQKFCSDANIPCSPVNKEKYFQPNMIEGAFLTTEASFDFDILKKEIFNNVVKWEKFEILFNFRIQNIKKNDSNYVIEGLDNNYYETSFIVNATYASINQIQNFLNLEPIKIKYELCEVVLTKVNKEFSNVGITVMDGPFFSLMPFGKTGLHSLTSVNLTPHLTSKNALPTFSCQAFSSGKCTPKQLDNCNSCLFKPKTAWHSMEKLALKYLSPNIKLSYTKSLFSVKTVLLASEIDDSRPTLIRTLSKNPTFISILSGKINTIYDLEEIL
jgi:hypothetical protein